jgi:hypothetical protein
LLFGLGGGRHRVDVRVGSGTIWLRIGVEGSVAPAWREGSRGVESVEDRGGMLGVRVLVVCDFITLCVTLLLGHLTATLRFLDFTHSLRSIFEALHEVIVGHREGRMVVVGDHALRRLKMS